MRSTNAIAPRKSRNENRLCSFSSRDSHPSSSRSSSVTRVGASFGTPPSQGTQWRFVSVMRTTIARRRHSPEVREDLALVEREEAVLIRADLVDVDVVEARVDVLFDGAPMRGRIRAADDLLRDVVFAD